MTKNFALFILLYLFHASAAQAVDSDDASKVIRSDDELPKVESLNWLNQNFLTKQRRTIDDLSRTHFGRTIDSNKEDLNTLQRIIDKGLIEKSNTKDLQALGVVLGDVYVKEVKELEWKIFTDELGPTHAVCVKNTKHCIFVMTMLSRRMEVGLKPEVAKVYQKGLDAIKSELPKLPYSVSQ